MTRFPFVALAVLVFSAIAPLSGQPVEDLQITVVRGEGALNNIREKLAEDLVVKVLDADGRLVKGAEVVFTLPEYGPSGTFADGQRTSTVVTNDEGIASALKMVPNQEEGRFNIKVVARHQQHTADIVIGQSNTLAGGRSKPKEGGGNKKLIWVGIAGGAAAGIAIALAGGGGGGSSTPATVPATGISIGAVSVGGPQ